MDGVAELASRSFADVKWHLMTAELRRVSATRTGRPAAVAQAEQPPAAPARRMALPRRRRPAPLVDLAALRRASGAALSVALATIAWTLGAASPIMGAVNLP